MKKYSSNYSECIITSASNKFFPLLLNLLGSIEKNYPGHPDIYVYNLGLFLTFKKELEKIPWVHIMNIPHFVDHWRSCYTWKTYILNTPITELNFYLDAGCQILRPLDRLFEKISTQDYLAVSQGTEVNISDITPDEYIERFKLTSSQLSSNVIAAGIFGFKRNSSISPITEKIYAYGIEGLCLGFSKIDLWKSKGVNKTPITRECKIFRHDTTLLSILLQKEIPYLKIEPIELFSGKYEDNPQQFIWNIRMNYKKLDFINPKFLHKKPYGWYIHINRLFLFIFIIMKNISNVIKSKIIIKT